MTYFIRRVFEVYCLSTRLVGIEVQIGGNWIDIKAVPDALRDAILKQLGPIVVGQVSQRTTEIAIPTDGLLFEAELAHCSSCEPEMERRIELELKKLELELALLEQEIERRKKRIANGELSEFEPSAFAAGRDDTLAFDEVSTPFPAIGTRCPFIVDWCQR